MKRRDFLTVPFAGLVSGALLNFKGRSLSASESADSAKLGSIEKISESVIWTNPNPALRSRHSYFPSACQLADGTIFASHVIAEAFESVEFATRISVSRDMGETWELLPPVYDKSKNSVPTSDSLKLTRLGDSGLLLFGYEFFRNDPEVTMGNPETGGLLDDRILFLRSDDAGKSWSAPSEVPCRWGHHAEASGAITVLKNGDWVAPITEFANWENVRQEPSCGRLLRSSDEGKNWNDNAVIMALGENVAVFEQRICQLKGSGKLVSIAWNEDLKTGERYNNHYAVSEDNGITFSGGLDTGIRGQASSVCAIGGEKLLALHAKRRDTDRPGIYAYIVDLSDNKWNIESETLIWEPPMPVVRDANMAEIFAFLKFGQPGAYLLNDGTVLTTHWYIENGQGKTIAMRFRLPSIG